jgi:hypothetical protein
MPAPLVNEILQSLKCETINQLLELFLKNPTDVNG